MLQQHAQASESDQEEAGEEGPGQVQEDEQGWLWEILEGVLNEHQAGSHGESFKQDKAC